jgi:lipopolysaccharide transport system ATP-binding protein
VTAVDVRHLSKNYPLSKSQWGRLRHVFGSAAHTPKDGLWALRDVSFSVNRGEAFGIIGSNGSGKSTLLQIVAGILRPTSGSVEVHGRLSALLELGAGFAPEFTGHDNVYLNGSLLGLTREEIEERFAEIERFAGIGDFIGQPIRTYSTGMVLRLAFAVAAHVDPEILIVDEALAVGDIAFRQRCMRKIHDLRARGTTILFVSHDTTDVKALCERCLWLRNGVVQELGEADDVVAKYLSATLQREIGHNEIDYQKSPGNPVVESVAGGHRYGDGRAAITGVSLADQSGQSVRFIKPLERLVLRVGFRTNAPVASPIAGFLVRNQRGENIFGSNTARENYPLLPMSPGDAIHVEFHCAIPELARGAYRISVAVCDGNVEDFQVCDYIEDTIEIRAQSSSPASKGYFHLPCAAVTVHRNQRCK